MSLAPLLAIFTSLLSVIVAYLLNQLPALRDFPGKSRLLIELVLFLTLLPLLLVLAIESENGSSFQISLLFISSVLSIALIFDSFKLVKLLNQNVVNAHEDQIPTDLWDRLLKEVRLQIRQRLEYVLGRQALINVVMTPKSESVDGMPRVGDVVLEPVIQPKQRWHWKRIFDRESHELPLSTTVLDTFDHEDIAGRLLILGKPGSGKTTTLLKLASSLIERAEIYNQIPYIFELSAWRNDQQEILDWLIVQLYLDHKISKNTSRQWIANGRLLPLLDGLDELGKVRQKLCIEKINAFVSSIPGIQVVVCCRSEEYDEGEWLLSSLNGALSLRPLSNEQIKQYLTDVGKPEIWPALSDTSRLAPLLSTIDSSSEVAEASNPILRIPLFLQLLVIAYQPEDQINSKADLFEAYIRRQLSIESRQWARSQAKVSKQLLNYAYPKIKNEPSSYQTKHYLVWLAKRLNENQSTNNFLIEQIQPSWLLTFQSKLRYRLLGTCLTFGVSSMFLNIRVCLFIACVTALFWNAEDIRPVERFQFPSMDIVYKEMFVVFQKRLREGLIWGPSSIWLMLVLGVFASFFDPDPSSSLKSLTDSWTQALITILGFFLIGLILGLIGGLLYALATGLIFGFVQRFVANLKGSFQVIETPNQKIFASAKNFLIVAFLSSTLCFTAALLANYYYYKMDNPIGFAIGVCILIAFPFSIWWGGGSAVVRHATLRLLLYRQGYIPWNYARFLKFTTERRLTQNVGGRFRFIHRELLDHFAQNYRFLSERELR